MLARLAEAQNWRCAYCGFHIWLPQVASGSMNFPPRAGTAYRRRKVKFSRATLDHVVPRSMGGGNNWENLIAACAWCNNARSNQPAEAAFERMQQLVQSGDHPHASLEKWGSRWRKGKGVGGMQTIYCERIAA